MSDVTGRDEAVSAAVRPLTIAVTVALVAALGALVWAFVLQQRLTETEAKLMQDRGALSRQLKEADAKIQANSANVDEQMTRAQQQQAALAARAQALAADANRLQKTQAATNEKLGSVETDVSGVKTDVGSVKSDVSTTKTQLAATQTDVADTKSLLQRTVGDAGVMSGLIARNHDELEVLKHRGDRTYYEFTLRKNAPATLLATVKLQLKKVNEKKSRFNLVVSSDDRNIEKKDKTVDEPIQFYTGKSPVLYEMVVNQVGKDTVSGYLSVPKGM